MQACTHDQVKAPVWWTQLKVCTITGTALSGPQTHTHTAPHHRELHCPHTHTQPHITVNYAALYLQLPNPKQWTKLAFHCKQAVLLFSHSPFLFLLTCVDLRLDMVIPWVPWNLLMKGLHSTSKRRQQYYWCPKGRKNTDRPRKNLLQPAYNSGSNNACPSNGKRLHGI